MEAYGWRVLLILLKECFNDVSIGIRKEVQTLPLDAPLSFLHMAKLPLLLLLGACNVRAVDNRVVFQLRDLEVRGRTNFLKSCIVGCFCGEGGTILEIEKWVAKEWGITTDVKVHRLCDGLLIFCLPSEVKASQVLNEGLRVKRDIPIHLDRWGFKVSCTGHMKVLARGGYRLWGC
ncbi:hypothetical protein L1049_027753 [Liquidambar formosana]|uniref:DUF4283 domain-containing protein n=1 Tax=Liquidambar formosana TaxID=63359 RepID=A0AAP0RJC1_LIQFO